MEKITRQLSAKRLTITLGPFLNLNFRGRGFVRAAVLIPYIVPAAVVAIIWRFMVDANFGIINDILFRLGIIDQYEAWMSQPTAAFSIIAMALIWAGFPFYAITLLAALQAIPDSLYEAARIDGASEWQQFRFITIPMILQPSYCSCCCVRFGSRTTLILSS